MRSGAVPRQPERFRNHPFVAHLADAKLAALKSRRRGDRLVIDEVSAGEESVPPAPVAQRKHVPFDKQVGYDIAVVDAVAGELIKTETRTAILSSYCEMLRIRSLTDQFAFYGAAPARIRRSPPPDVLLGHIVDIHAECTDPLGSVLSGADLDRGKAEVGSSGGCVNIRQFAGCLRTGYGRPKIQIETNLAVCALDKGEQTRIVTRTKSRSQRVLFGKQDIK